MDNNLQWLEVGTKKYPMLFSMNVMEALQDKYETLEKWGEILQPKDGKEPKISAVIDTFLLIINEGIDYVNFEESKNEPLLERKIVGRIITKLGLQNATKEMQKLVINSTKEDNPKNE